MEYEYHMKPMSVPVWSVNGLNAGDGGVGNLLQDDSGGVTQAYSMDESDYVEDNSVDGGFNFDMPLASFAASDAGGEAGSEVINDSEPASSGLPPPPPPPPHGPPDDARRAAANGKQKARCSSASSVASSASFSVADGSWAAASAELKPLNLGGSGMEKYRPPSKRKVASAEGLAQVLTQFAESVASQAAEDRKAAADLAREAREEARAEREHQMAMMSQCKQQGAAPHFSTLFILPSFPNRTVYTG
jgi:hypothetical protein